MRVNFLDAHVNANILKVPILEIFCSQLAYNISAVVLILANYHAPTKLANNKAK